MNPDIKTTNVRFNLDKDDQRRAWEYLQSMDKRVFRSYSHVISLALLDYFDRYYRLQEDPYFETREREERFVQEIVDAVSESLRQILPLFLAGCMTGLSSLQPASDPTLQLAQSETIAAEAPEETMPEDIDWDFLGS